MCGGRHIYVVYSGRTQETRQVMSESYERGLQSGEGFQAERRENAKIL